MLRQPILLLARSAQAERLVSNLPLSRAVVRRFVPGTQTDEAVRATRELAGEGLLVTLDHLGEDTLDRAQADATVAAYLELLEALGAAGLARSAEVSVKLSAIGQALPDGGPDLATDNARRICGAARTVGTTVTLDMEDHTTVDLALTTLRELRRDFPETGAVLQAYLHRTEDDCRDLAHEGSRVRLCKGAYDEPASVAFQEREEVDKSYVRCLKVLMAGSGYPMVATHDPRMIKIASALAVRAGRVPGSHEFQMLYGVRPDEQRRLAEAGEQVRVYLPYGEQWYGYLMRRLAERPQNLAFFARALVSRS